MVFSKEVVDELKKYNTVEDFWYSDYGGPIIDKIIDCLERGNENRVVIIDNQAPSEIKTVEETKQCLVKSEWYYPNKLKPTRVWKFSSDGTFIFTNTFKGLYKNWGNWDVYTPQEIKISYTGTSDGYNLEEDSLNLSTCDKLKFGEVSYWKN